MRILNSLPFPKEILELALSVWGLPLNESSIERYHRILPPLSVLTENIPNEDDMRALFK